MAGPTTEVLASDLKELTRAVGDLLESCRSARFDGYGEFRSEVTTQLGVIKWIGSFFAGILVMLVGTSLAVAWNASAINSEVKQHGIRLGAMETRLGAVEKKLDAIDGRLGAIDGRLDGMTKQLDTLIRRAEPKPGG